VRNGIVTGEGQEMKTELVCGAIALLSFVSGAAQAQTSDSYKGFRIGMTLSEGVAVGGGNFNQVQAVCANPPVQLSTEQREFVTKECAKVQQTLSGQPTEWEFPKEQIRLAFENGHLIRVSDFDGVIHLQAGTSSAFQAPSLASTPSNDVQDVAAASRAMKAKQATQVQAAQSTTVPPPTATAVGGQQELTTAQTKADLSASPTIEEVMAYIRAHKESDPAPPLLKQQNLGPAFSHAAMKALIYIGVSHDEAQSWLRAAEDLASPGPDGVPEMSALIDLHKMEVRAYNRQKAPEDCQTAIYFQLEIRHYFSTPIACGFEAKK
jgi:hypothetical protein